MRNFEKPNEQSTKVKVEQAPIIRWALKLVDNASNLNEDDREEIKKYYEGIGAREGAAILVEKLFTLRSYKQDSNSYEEVDEQNQIPYLIAEIEALYGQKEIQKAFDELYNQFRTDIKENRNTEKFITWDNLRVALKKVSKEYEELERALHTGQIKGRHSKSVITNKMARLAKNKVQLEESLKKLESTPPKGASKEDADVLAEIMFRRLEKYKTELNKEGFVWLPSRMKIHKDIVNAILNHRWPLLIGEAGTGKSQQANAAAEELTGHPALEIECEATTSELDLIGDTAIDPETGGSYKEYGPLMRAYTGFNDSREMSPTFNVGRIVRLDESGRLGPKAYSVIKKARQKKAGDDFYDKIVLPGAGAILTSNPVGVRYPDRHAPDPAMRREFSEIFVDYPPMTPKNPELYEFALVALLSEDMHTSVAQEELAPKYIKKDIPEDEQTTLGNSVIVARDELLPSITDNQHGVLWRFSFAVKAIQDAFVYGNVDSSMKPDSLLRFVEGEDNELIISTDNTGELLTLSTSTITLGELASWLSSFESRKQRSEKEFHVDTLAEWLHLKASAYIKQANEVDRGKIKAIFKYFNILLDIDKSVKFEIEDNRPITRKEIGFLSPRVPRPVYVQESSNDGQLENDSNDDPTINNEKYETRQLVLVNGDLVNVVSREAVIREGTFDITTEELKPHTINVGDFIRYKGDIYTFVGIDESNSKSFIVQKQGVDDLYIKLTEQEVDIGVTLQELYTLRNNKEALEETTETFISNYCPQ